MSTIRDAGLVECKPQRLSFDLVFHHISTVRNPETLVHEQDASKSAPRLVVCGADAPELVRQDANHCDAIEVLRLPRTPVQICAALNGESSLHGRVLRAGRQANDGRLSLDISSADSAYPSVD
jgi:hypothetical protein